MDHSNLSKSFDKETLSKLANVITPTATRKEIAEGAAELGISLSEEQLNSICEFISDSRELSDDELMAVTGGKAFLYGQKKTNLLSGGTDQFFKQFLEKFASIFGIDDIR